MPFVQVSFEVQLHYEIIYCTPGDNASAANRPWLMVLHPLLMDSSYLKDFCDQPAIRASFNQVLFDGRHHGRSENLSSNPTDLFSLAADLAIGLEKLQIKAVHAFGTHPWSSEIVLRMAAVFPSKVLSLCLCSIAPTEVDPYIERASRECYEACAHPESVEEWDEGAGAVQWFNFGDPSLVDRDILDEWASNLLRRIPPSRSSNCCLYILPFLGACQVSKTDFIPDAMRLEVKIPILILRGANDTIFTELGSCERLEEFPFHEHSKVITIEDAPLLFIKTHPLETQQHYLDWMKEILAGGKYSGKHNPATTCWKSSLEKLGHHFKDLPIATRDPFQSDSYNRNTPEEKAFFCQILAELKAGQVKTFSLLGGGAPDPWTNASFEEKVPWRFSSRFDEARLSSKAPVFIQHSEHDCEIEEIQIKTSVEVSYQDLMYPGPTGVV